LTQEIATTLIILAIAVVLFISERLRADLIALLVLASLALTELVTPSEALSGFSNPAVVTVWAMFILSAGLSLSGVASMVGRQVLRLSGNGESRLILVIMSTAGLMSAFMNNVGVAALLLPVVMNITRRTRRPPSKLLIPLAFGCLMGGMTTLISTPTNILASEALLSSGFRPFRLFDYTPVGLVLMVFGVAFMVLIGKRLLPVRDVGGGFHERGIEELSEIYNLEKRLHMLHIPATSPLTGKTLSQSRLGTTLGLTVIGIQRGEQISLAPDPNSILQGDDRLLVAGRIGRLMELHDVSHLVIESTEVTLDDLMSSAVDVAEVSLSSDSPLIGKNLLEVDFRQQFGVVVLAIWRGSGTLSMDFDEEPLQKEDILLVHGDREQLKKIDDFPEFTRIDFDRAKASRLKERLLKVRVPEASNLVGKTLSESRLAKELDLMVMGIVRKGKTRLVPAPEERLQANDILLVKGSAANVLALGGLQNLEVEEDTVPTLQELESEQIGIVEAVLSPHTMLVGKSLRQLHFRAKYGLTVLAILRGGKVYYNDLHIRPLRFGDALLLYGSRARLTILASEPDFLVLEEDIQEAPRLKKAPLAALLMLAVIVPVILGWVSIVVSAVVGATLMILTGCLSIDEAYRYIEWPAVFLIAGMLPLGIAMETSGAASFIANGMISLVGDYGPLAVMAGMFLLTNLGSQVMPNAVVTVLMAPIAINMSGNLGVSPYTLMMVVAVAASASFMSPVGHPANVLVMGPGGYKFADYVKVGLPLTILMLVVGLLVIPIFWPP
jgi:di/tricarboxylate transporter